MGLNEILQRELVNTLKLPQYGNEFRDSRLNFKEIRSFAEILQKFLDLLKKFISGSDEIHSPP